MSYNMQEATSFAKKHNLNLTQLVSNGDKKQVYIIYTPILEKQHRHHHTKHPHPPILPSPPSPMTSLASARRRKVLRAAQHLGVHLRPEMSYMKTLLETNSSLPLKIGRAPTGNNRSIPTIPENRCEVLVAGRVYSNGFLYKHWGIIIVG